MRKTGAILLRCDGCGRAVPYDRGIDPGIPDRVHTIGMSACDRCDRGDRVSERWLDVLGREVRQVD